MLYNLFLGKYIYGKMFFRDRFKDKVIIVTGGSKGIGKATALRAAKEGAHVVVVSRSKRYGEETLSEIINNGGSAIYLSLDLSLEDSCKRMVDETIESFGRLDIAINNAGVLGKSCPVHQLTKEDMDYTMKNNFYSVYFSCKYELNQFIIQNNGGVIVNVGSVAGLVGVPGNPAYCASKHAVNGLTKTLALDYGRYGIRINSVNPANTDTPMTQQAYAEVMAKMADAKAKGLDLSKLSTMASQKRKAIIERQATPDEQAASILYLASDDATHMTGATLQTDGGWTSF